MRPIISIVIATFNSDHTLSLVLESIKSQTFPKNKIEVLVVDGGSTDETLKIAKKYRSKILHNSRTEPVSAKLLGYSVAKGDYLVYLDADEVIENSNSLYIKHTMFMKNGRVKAVIGSGYSNPIDGSFLTSYINDFGDPFSFFIYRLSKNSKFYYLGLKKRFLTIRDNRDSVIFDFSKKGESLLLELGAANSMIDLKYLRKEFPNFTPEVFAHLFQLLISKSNLISFTKNDSVIHYATSDLKSYINKLSWRIKNNIYYSSTMGISGFKGREKLHPASLKLKKFLFVPYAYSILLPLVDAVLLALTRQRIDYFLHLPLTIFTASLILYYLFLRALGYSPQLRSYDESKILSKTQ